MPAPTDRQQPRARSCHRRCIPCGSESVSATVEPACRRGRIDGAEVGSVRRSFARPSVAEDIGKRPTDFARCSQDVEVVTVGQHPAVRREDPLHRSRDARAERLHSASQVVPARRLDDRVHVIQLDRVVRDAEAPALARSAKARLELTGSVQREPAERGGHCADPTQDAEQLELGLRPRPSLMASKLTRLCVRCGHTALDSRDVLARLAEAGFDPSPAQTSPYRRTLRRYTSPPSPARPGPSSHPLDGRTARQPRRYSRTRFASASGVKPKYSASFFHGAEAPKRSMP